MNPLADASPEVLASLTVLQRLIARLVFERHKLSRNKSFEAFDDPEVQRAVRQARHLASVIRDLRDPGSTIGVTTDPRRPGEIRVVMVFSCREGRRAAWLSADEQAVLRLDAEAWARVAAGLQ